MSETSQLEWPKETVEGFLVAITRPEDSPNPFTNIDIQNLLQEYIVEHGFTWTYAEVTPMGVIENLGADLES